MSTKADRAFRSANRILPITVKVRQKDGRFTAQRVDADVKTSKVSGTRGAINRAAVME